MMVDFLSYFNSSKPFIPGLLQFLVQKIKPKLFLHPDKKFVFSEERRREYNNTYDRVDIHSFSYVFLFLTKNK